LLPSCLSREVGTTFLDSFVRSLAGLRPPIRPAVPVAASDFRAMPPRKRRLDVEEPAAGASPLPDDEARDAANTDRSPPPALDARAAAAAAVLAEELAEEDGNGEDAAEAGRAAERRERAGRASRDCPYLDTVSRSLLDFDFEKCCSVTLSPNNVYACLSCGKYFQGRGPNTQANPLTPESATLNPEP